MRLALVLHPSREASADVARVFTAAAAERGIEVTVPLEDAARVPKAAPRDSEDSLDAELIVAVGGDGTVLEATRLGRRFDLPVLGVNAGRMGFLAEVQPARVKAAIDALVEGAYRESHRMTLRTEFPDGRAVDGLNDVVVEKALSQHVVGISVSVAGERLVEYRTDAVIVATPTGSTAYTFSAGGPLVDPEMEALVLTAVAPHNLFSRAIVFSSDVVLDITITADRSARVNVDGHTQAELAPTETVRVTRGPTPVRLIRLSPENFARTVKEKFHLHDD